jgi:hypothetical protein
MIPLLELSGGATQYKDSLQMPSIASSSSLGFLLRSAQEYRPDEDA